MSDNATKAKLPLPWGSTYRDPSTHEPCLQSFGLLCLIYSKKGQCFWNGIINASSSRMLFCTMVSRYGYFNLFFLSDSTGLPEWDGLQKPWKFPSDRLSLSTTYNLLLTYLCSRNTPDTLAGGAFLWSFLYQAAMKEACCWMALPSLRKMLTQLWRFYLDSKGPVGQPKHGKYLSLIVNIIFSFLTFP